MSPAEWVPAVSPTDPRFQQEGGGGIGVLPAEVGWPHIVGAGLLAGIGFTVSLFVAGLAFTDPALVAEAKIGIIIASVTALVLGSAVLAWASARAPDPVTASSTSG